MLLNTKERRCCRPLSDKTSQSSSLIASDAEERLTLLRITRAALFCNTIRVLRPEASKSFAQNAVCRTVIFDF